MIASEVFHDDGDDERVAVFVHSIGFDLLRVECPVAPGPGTGEVAAKAGPAVLGGEGLSGLDGRRNFGVGDAAFGSAGDGVRVETDEQVSRPSSTR